MAAIVGISCWSGFNIVSRLGTQSSLTPFDLVALRFGVAVCFMAPVFIISRNPLPRLRLLVLSVSGGAGYALCIYTGFSMAPAAHAGILVNGGIPVATALLAWLWLKERPTKPLMMALALAASGLVLIAWNQRHAHADHLTWLGDLCYPLAPISPSDLVALFPALSFRNS